MDYNRYAHADTLPRDAEVWCADATEQALAPLTAYAWPGGYEVIYLSNDNEVICATCAREYDDATDCYCGHTSDCHSPIGRHHCNVCPPDAISSGYDCREYTRSNVGEIATGYMVLEGSYEDHGLVQCATCNRVILDETTD